MKIDKMFKYVKICKIKYVSFFLNTSFQLNYTHIVITQETVIFHHI